MPQTPYFLYNSKLAGQLLLWNQYEKGVSNLHLDFLDYPEEKDESLLAQGWEKNPEFFEKEVTALDRFFRGEESYYQPDWGRLKGTDFQIKVWKILHQISRGKILSYGKVAHLLGDKNLARAVGTACGKNPLPLLIPCHRVLAKNGLGGFAPGLELKKKLLKFEEVHL